MYKLKIIPILALVLFSCTKSRKNNGVQIAPIYQIGTFQKLSSGNYLGILPVGFALNYGDFGLGAATQTAHSKVYFKEITLYNNKIYGFDSAGVVHDITLANDSTPFLTVTNFSPQYTFEFNNPSSYKSIIKTLDSLLPDTSNNMFSIKIYGIFDSILTRSLPAFNQPVPLLTEVLKKQIIFKTENTKGTLVGFRFPLNKNASANTPGYHFHYISDDLHLAGHALNFEARNVKVYVGVHLTTTILKE